MSQLKSLMDKERKNHKQEYFSKLRENAFLLEEISQLKKELTGAKKYKLPSMREDFYKRRSSSARSSSRSISSKSRSSSFSRGSNLGSGH